MPAALSPLTSPDLGPQRDVDAGSRLVEDQQARLVDERASEDESPLHAPGQFVGPAVGLAPRGGPQRHERCQRRRQKNGGPRKSVAVFDSTVVAVQTDAGITGYGEVCPLGPVYLPAYANGVRTGMRGVAPKLIGEDPTQLGR